MRNFYCYVSEVWGNRFSISDIEYTEEIKKAGRITEFIFQWDFEIINFHYPGLGWRDIRDEWNYNGGWNSSSFEKVVYEKFDEYFNKKRGVYSDNPSGYGHGRFYYDMKSGFDYIDVPHFIDNKRYSYIPYNEYFLCDFKNYFHSINREDDGFKRNMAFWMWLMFNIEFHSIKYAKKIPNKWYDGKTTELTERIIKNRMAEIENILCADPSQMALKYFDLFLKKNKVYSHEIKPQLA